MINRRSVLLGSVSAAVLTTTKLPELTQDELSLIAVAARPRLSSVEEYNRTRIIKNGTEAKQMIDSLVARGYFTCERTTNPNADCDYFVRPTEKGLAILRG
jgi:DNA-binding MarR family transcriptional regulator